MWSLAGTTTGSEWTCFWVDLDVFFLPLFFGDLFFFRVITDLSHALPEAGGISMLRHYVVCRWEVSWSPAAIG